MNDDRRPRRALALHFAPEEIRGILSRDPRFEWAFASAPGEVLPALEAHRPEVVFSLKQSSFPGPAHVPAILDPGVEWFHVAGSGVDHVESHLRPDQRLTSGRGVLAPFIAERAMAGLLHLVTGMDAMRAAAARWSPAVPPAGREARSRGRRGGGSRLRAADQALRMPRDGDPGVGRAPGFDAMHGPEDLDALLPEADVVAPRPAGRADARGSTRAVSNCFRRGAAAQRGARGRR